jgi:hypothetical protein
VCLLLLHHRTREDHPVVLLANRDEAYDRPFREPRLLDETLGIVAPTDTLAGGTWLGVNRHGVVAAITNRPGEDRREGLRSRGRLVLDALRHDSARRSLDAAAKHLRTTAYAGFHLLVADPAEAFVIRHRGAATPTPPRPEDVLVLGPGVHVLTNLHEPGAVPAPEGGHPDPAEPIERTLERLARLATDERPRLPGRHRILKRGATRGTVCSAILAPPIFRFAAGPPDRAPFVDVPLAR